MRLTIVNVRIKPLLNIHIKRSTSILDCKRPGRTSILQLKTLLRYNVLRTNCYMVPVPLATIRVVEKNMPPDYTHSSGGAAPLEEKSSKNAQKNDSDSYSSTSIFW